MDKLRIFLNSKIGWIMEVLITVTILFTSLFLPTAFVDIAVSVTIILMVVGVYAIYGFFFNKEKRTAYGFLLFNIFLSMMFANRLYIYDNLVHIFPIIDQVDKGACVLAVFLLVTFVFTLVKVSQKIGDIAKEEKIVEENEKQNQCELENQRKQKNENYVANEKVQQEWKKENENENLKGRTDVDSTKLATSMKASTFYYVVSVIVMLLIIVALSFFLIFKVNGMPLDKMKANPMENATTVFIYGILFLMVAFAVVFGFLILLTFSSYLVRKVLQFVNELKNPQKEKDEENGIPLYVLSVFVVLALFYLSYKMGKFTIDDFTNFAIDGKYLAYPLLLILIITVFVLLLWIVHGMLALISTINGKSIKEKFKSIEEEICLGENCKEIIKALFDYAKATRYWKSDEFEDAKTNLEEKNRVYTAAKNELTQAQNDLMDAEDAVTNYKPSSGSLVMEMLVEFLKPNFNINDMNKHMEDLVDYVLSIGEGEQIPSNYAEIVETVLEINNVLDDYSRLKNADDSESAEEKIKQLKIDVEEKLTIPNPQEDDFENTKTMWVAEWKTRLENLREIVWRIPSYSGEEIAAFSASGIEINKDALEYDSTDISNKIDRLERNKLTDINVMEKVCLLISGKYPLTAIVALLIAIELDMISLLVGVVIYWMSKVSKGTDKEIVLT